MWLHDAFVPTDPDETALDISFKNYHAYEYVEPEREDWEVDVLVDIPEKEEGSTEEVEPDITINEVYLYDTFVRKIYEYAFYKGIQWEKQKQHGGKTMEITVNVKIGFEESVMALIAGLIRKPVEPTGKAAVVASTTPTGVKEPDKEASQNETPGINVYTLAQKQRYTAEETEALKAELTRKGIAFKAKDTGAILHQMVIAGVGTGVAGEVPPGEETAAASTTEAPKYTQEEIRASVQAYLMAAPNRDGAATQIRTWLAEFGVKSIPDLKEENYTAFMNKVKGV